MPRSLVLTCEHASRRVPARLRDAFRGHETLLASHRGCDAGAIEIARALRDATGAPLRQGEWTRLVVDLNRPETSSSLFSEIAAGWTDSVKESWLEQVHRPHWREVESTIWRAAARSTPVLHLGVHSFTPVWHGEDRGVDLSLLYDPSRERERQLALEWTRRLRETLPGWRVRRNRPYRGNEPGLTTSLRSALRVRDYLGIELEVRADYATEPAHRRAAVAALVPLLREWIAGPQATDRQTTKAR